MADCVQIMRENSQAFLDNLKTTDSSIKSKTEGFLRKNEGSLFYLETSDAEVTRILLAQVLRDFKEITILKEKKNLNEILFTDFSSFTTMTSEQNEDFKENFPDLLVCILDNEEELSKQSHILELWINIIKEKGKKIILIVKNPKDLKKIIMDNKMANIVKLKLDKLLWKEITSNNEAICEIGNKLENIEPTSTRALNECTNVNLKQEELTEKTSSHGEATTKEADLKNLLQSLGVNELNDVDTHGNTQLHLAAYHGKPKIVESILVHGAKKDVGNNDVETALHLAARKGHRTIVEMLLEYGFNVNAANIEGWVPLHCASFYHNDADLIEIILKFGAEIERKNIYGRTALHRASISGHSAVVNLLLKNGANINAQDNYGYTSLHIATSKNKQEVVLILLQHGALLDIKNRDQQNALDCARSWRRTEIIQIMENHKLMMSQQNK